jgi:transcriptional/translational regulatory protein YebC/TACO1
MAESKGKVEVVLSAKGLTDSDMQRVVQEAIIEQQSTVLNLSYNKITHEGVSIIAEALRNNTVRKILLPVNLSYSITLV